MSARQCVPAIYTRVRGGSLDLENALDDQAVSKETD